MIPDILAHQGSWFFRWRSYVLLGFLPVALLTLSHGEPVEIYLGERADFIYEGICVALAFFGLGIRALTVGYTPKGTSGRNTREQIAATLNVTGMYSLTRNPLYLGNAITYMAIALFTQGFYFTILMALFLIIYLERIIAAEERFLTEKFGAHYMEWANLVPAFFPSLSGWKAPELDFSMRNVLRREYSGFFAIIAAFVAIEALGDLLYRGRMLLDEAWAIAFITGAIIYLTLRSLNRSTRVLNVPGR